jgi:hypothetical protein
MNINMQSVLKAAGIGAAINAVVGIMSALPGIQGLEMLAFLVWPLYCCGFLLIPITTGALYGYFTPGKETMGEAAGGGAISGMVAGLIYGLFSGALQIVVGLINGWDFEIIMTNAGGAVLGGCCIAIFLGSVLGAIGGVIWTAVQGDK